MDEQLKNDSVRLVRVLWNAWRTIWWWVFVLVVIFLISRLFFS